MSTPLTSPTACPMNTTAETSVNETRRGNTEEKSSALHDIVTTARPNFETGEPERPPTSPAVSFEDSSAIIRRNLWFFIWLKAIGSYDSGAFSAVLGAENGIAEQWGLSTVQQGSLTSSVFLGNVLGCPLAGHLFSQYDEKRIFGYSLFFHMMFSFLFGMFQEYYIALINRFFIGLTLAFIVVYTPVWVDEFAPKERQSMWMAFQNAGVPLGIMIGYVLGAFFPTYTALSWDGSFYIKGILMIPTVIYLARADRMTINTRCRGVSGLSPQTTSSGENGRQRVGPSFRARLRPFLATMRHLVTNVVYMCSTLSMCALYFAATGLQNFVTPYLRGEPFNAPMQTIMLGFGVAVVTAPVCGVIAGGIILDRIGGYSTDVLRTCLFALACGGIGGLCAIVCIFMKSTGSFLLVMSVLLFCGGAIIPPGVGLTMSSISSSRRSAGAAFSQTVYNLLGNFSGPLVCGFVADWTGNLRNGIITVLISSVLGVIPLIVLASLALLRPQCLSPRTTQRHSIDRRAVIVEVGSAEPHDDPLASAERVSPTLSAVTPLNSRGHTASPDFSVEFQQVGRTSADATEHAVVSVEPSPHPSGIYANNHDEVLLERLMSRRYCEEEELDLNGTLGRRSRLRRPSQLLQSSSRASFTATIGDHRWSESVSLPNQHNFGMEVVRSILQPTYEGGTAESSSSEPEESELEEGGETSSPPAPTLQRSVSEW